jgi:outer membrane protein TolC
MMRRAYRALCLTLLGSLVAGAELLTLEQAQKQALKQSWQMRINAADDTARNWQKKNVIAGYLPQLSYGATLTRMDQKTTDRANFVFSMVPPGLDVEALKTRLSSLSHEFTISQPITNGGAEIIAIKMADHTKKAQLSGYEADRQELSLTVIRQYFDCIRMLEQQEILRADQKWAEKNLETSKIRVEGGMISRTDLLRWHQLVTEKKSALVHMSAAAAISRAALASTLGMEPADAPQWQIQLFEDFEKKFNALGDLPDGSIEDNARVLALESYRRLAEDNRKMAIAAAMPKLNTFATYSREQGWDSPGDIFTREGTWVGGLSLAVPIFSGFRNSTKYQETKYDALKTEMTLRQTKNQLTTNCIRIREFYTASKLTAQSARELMELTRENLEIMTARYNAGQLTQLDLLEMNKALVATRIDYVNKVLETLTLHAEYANAIGKTEEVQ